ncbi:DUF4288 domain-containing protein [Streptomyces rimosus]|uniref:DUF4288 domain-containing protein n=1 Tax=Streptomyces rimosus TaxID=1927 RepID=UPI000AE5AD34|nr:DUF4288 domain-containing protein [Streptomyces rimosus]
MLNPQVFQPAERARTESVPPRRWAVAHGRSAAEDSECAVATGTERKGGPARGLRPHIAVVLMESSGTGGSDPLYEESVVLVYAADEADARNRAERRARSREAGYLNDRGETVTWTFKRVVDVCAVLDEDLTQDADLYARHFRDYAAYERFEPLLSGEEL